MIIEILNLLLLIVLIGLGFYLVIYVLRAVGIPVPERVIQLLGVAALLVVLLWFFSGHVPLVVR